MSVDAGVESLTARSRSARRYDVLVVGAGFAGAVMAQRAAQNGNRVLVVERRDHIAGNAFDYHDEHGVLVHRYGPHIFHTNSRRVSDYLSRFTGWREYEHRVLAAVDDKLVPLPINRTTVNALCGQSLLNPAEVERYLDSLAEPCARQENSEQAVVSQVGRDLYERLFRGYTRKQWGLDPAQLDASVCARIPVRFDDEDRYFTDSFQQMPIDGYTAMFERLLDHPLIERQLSISFDEIGESLRYRTLVWTGPIDAYFNCALGALPYRSLRFNLRTVQCTDPDQLNQPVGQVNYPSEDVPYTRITEYRHLTGQRGTFSTIACEYPTATGEPYYPVPRPRNRELYRAYAQLADAERDVIFVGRLARYQYLNMDQVVAQALKAADSVFGEERVRAVQRVAA